MNKKFLSAILFGALMVTSTGTFVSCKDYDDEIENLQGQISANTTAIAELKSLIQNGDYVTNVEVSGSNLVVSFKNAGSKTYALENEGGSKAEVKGDELYIDGEATGIKVDGEFQEAVKIVEGEWAVLQEDGTYKKIPETTVSTNPVANPRIKQVETNNLNLERLRKQQDEYTIKKMEVENDLRKELSTNIGFLEELHAMLELLSSRTEALIFYCIIFSFLISLELFVVASKMSDKKCDYDMIVEHQLNVKAIALGELVRNMNKNQA